MQEFVIEKGSFRKIQKRILISTIAIMAIALIAVIVISLANKDDVTSTPYFISVITVVVIMGFSIYRGVKKQQVLFESYSLTIDDDVLIRKQLNMPTITIYRDDVTSITKSTDGSFAVKARRSNSDIYISTHISNYEQLEQILNKIEPVTLKTTSVSQQLSANIAAALATVGLMVCVYVASNKILVGASGFILLLVLFVSFGKIQLNKNVSSQVKRSSYWLIPVVLSIAAIVYYKLVA